MRYWILILMLASACGDDDTAEVQPPAPPEATPEPPEPAPEATTPAVERASQADRARAAALLAEGRRLVRDDQYAEGLAKLREALELVPEDGTTLCEAGWAAFLAEDPQAGDLLRRGTSFQTDPRKRAACIYNRGRVAEREAERAESEEARTAARARAAALYADSLALRPDNVPTRERLEALQGTGERPPEGCPPGGTFADVDAYCAALPLMGEEDFTECGTAPTSVEVEGEGPGDLVMVAVSGDYASLTTYHLLLRRDGQLEPLVVLGFDHDRSCSSSAFEVRSLRWVDAEPGPTLVTESTYAESYCARTAWERCMIEGTEERCADEPDEVEMVENTETYREACVAEAGGYRCTSGASFLSPDVPRLPAEGPLPEGAALQGFLRCL